MLSSSRRVSIHSGKRKLSSAAQADPRESGGRNVRKSAWPKQKTEAHKLSKFPALISCSFTRLTASLDGPDVTFIQSNTVESILIAENWKEGWENSQDGKPFEKTGYIGHRAVKRVIYVSPNAFLPAMDILTSHRHNSTGKNMHWVKAGIISAQMRSRIMLAYFEGSLRTLSREKLFGKHLKTSHLILALSYPVRCA